MSEWLRRQKLQQSWTLYSNILMKRSVIAAALLLMSLCFGERLSAADFGLVGGANFHTYNPKDIGMKTLTQWHAGLTCKFNLPLGFQIHPSLLYNVKDATTSRADLDLTVGYLEFMAAVQWGADLILFRPYLTVNPFIGYGLNGWGDFKDMWKKDGNRLEYGVGLGGGLQIWRFQLEARYNWNFGNIMPSSSAGGVFKGADFSGVTLSLAYFF